MPCPDSQQNGGMSWGAAREGVSVYCLGSPAPEPSTVKGKSQGCMYLTDILNVPGFSVLGNGGSGGSVQRPAPGGSRGPAPSESPGV